MLAGSGVVRIAGAHDALGGVLAQESGFQGVWSSSLEVSAARCLPDASLLTMTEYLQAAANMQKALSIPVVADCDTGYGNAMNVAHMVHEYQAAGITAVSMEDKLFPKMNSFVAGGQALLPAEDFAHKIETAKNSQQGDDFFVIARTEALISGQTVAEALERCHRYVDAGADAVLIHSKARTNEQVLEFLAAWRGRRPVVIVPTTYPGWHFEDAARAGVSVVIYANQGLRAVIASLRATFRSIYEHGESTALEDGIASVSDIFSLQRLSDWRKLEV
ncbi:isocitrate lyase/phosphoenolpyruvate mutase family protein [Saccharothrix algeriensis]|uniref:Isocitrate lyase/phosphoenolpyruvate mutase family protein n=1 Tax=Saccharothrix algeriensis TaxID=173560 RepID=A0A8T8HX34_9PSEU|nr:isocitrate lyase/phosphoenolpyruvate mutase family protein [Saccharothrix algeriensis]MBM7814462.1 phosphoenolpyruvate phosphomutase [Saccharothrix algeriensis]QTR02760.1 isocitrate lyase/phosphoenolpyruvate mutase family protein [Saccharothrix algeriensis]